MKQVNFRHAGGFPLEQETLERLQTAYRSELYEALKKHLSIELGTNYIIAPATANSKGWAVIHQYEVDATGETTLQGILYPISNYPVEQYLRTTRTETNLIYGTGTSQTAYFDYDAKYINKSDYDNRIIEEEEEDGKVRVYDFYDTKNVGFSKVKDIKAIEEILDSIDSQIATIKTDINTVKENYLPLNGSKAMQGDLSLGTHQLYLNNLNTATSDDFLLAVNNQNQVVKNNTLLQSLVNRIITLEGKQSTAVPLGMIAIWGKTEPIPDGWEEYVPLQGRMPVGFTESDDEFNVIGEFGGTKSSVGLVPVPATGYTSSENTSNGTAGKLIISSGKEEKGENLESIAIVSSTPNIYFTVNTLNPYRVVRFIIYTGKSSDKTAPTIPTDLTLLNVTSSTVYFSWTKSTDNVGVDRYVIYKNGQPAAEVSGDISFYTAYSLNAGTEYSFAVAAKDARGNISEPCQPLVVITSNVSAIIPANVFIELQNVNEIYLNWDIPVDPGVIAYEIWRRESGGLSGPIGTSQRTKPYYYDAGDFNTTYYYKVRSQHISGNYSDFTTEIGITTEPGNIQCFDIESPVTMASGHSKKLKNIVVGDKLQGFTFPNEIDESEGDYMLWDGKLAEASKAEVVVVAKRTSTQPNYYEIRTADNTLKVTAEHPLLITEDGENVKWVSVKNVSENMLLIDKTGKTKAIESIVFKEEPLEVALLDVENVDNYIISGIVAHNSKPVDPL